MIIGIMFHSRTLPQRQLYWIQGTSHTAYEKSLLWASGQWDRNSSLDVRCFSTERRRRCAKLIDQSSHVAARGCSFRKVSRALTRRSHARDGVVQAGCISPPQNGGL